MVIKGKDQMINAQLTLSIFVAISMVEVVKYLIFVMMTNQNRSNDDARLDQLERVVEKFSEISLPESEKKD